MGSKFPATLPSIDFSNLELKSGTFVWDSIKQLVKKALVEYGCFEAVYKKITMEQRNTLYSSLQELFDLPLQTKSCQNVSKRPLDDYVGSNRERFAIVDGALNFEKVESFANMMWPLGNDSFCKNINDYAKQVVELEQLVRRLVLDSLGVEQYCDEHIKSSQYKLHLLKYNVPQANETKIGFTAHTDPNFITILSENNVQGLEVQTKDGQWIPVKLSPNSFLVQTGDSFVAWSNGRFQSPLHQVTTAKNEARYSVALFSIPSGIVEAPEELVDEDHPLLFKPFDYEVFFKLYFTGEGGTGRQMTFNSFMKTEYGV